MSRRDIGCDICKQVTNLVNQNLGDNASEGEITKALENVCSDVPTKRREKCDAFIEQYGNELIDILVEERDPGLACTLLGVCIPV